MSLLSSIIQESLFLIKLCNYLATKRLSGYICLIFMCCDSVTLVTSDFVVIKALQLPITLCNTFFWLNFSAQFYVCSVAEFKNVVGFCVTSMDFEIFKLLKMHCLTNIQFVASSVFSNQRSNVTTHHCTIQAAFVSSFHRLNIPVNLTMLFTKVPKVFLKNSR